MGEPKKTKSDALVHIAGNNKVTFLLLFTPWNNVFFLFKLAASSQTLW
jgi:hypothetical protein